MTSIPKEKNAAQGRYATQQIKTVTADYTLRASDCGTLILVNSGSGKTVTVPANLPVGFLCSVIQQGAGQITFAAGAGATLSNSASQTKASGQYAKCGIEVIAAGAAVLSGATGT